jgi:hypothetical protein
MSRPELKTTRGAIKLRVLRLLYEHTEDGRIYALNRLAGLLVGNGISWGYAKMLLWELYLMGLLERPKVGLYKVNKDRLKAYVEEYEAQLARLKSRGGGSGGPSPSQGGP